MPLIVQKFGGTSVADSQKMLAAARKAIRAQQEGAQVVMVVSAMGHNTDRLVDLANELTDEPPREMDMLLSTGEQVSVALMAMAIHSLGAKAISLTGAQIGIKTDSTHTKARIQSISTDRMRKALGEGKIVIAAGFQGIDEDFNITTLGRGGSDTTAVALAAVLSADACEIYTDVDGVYTTDPRILPEARRMRSVSYDEMLELASSGAGVMHNRSIEFAKRFGVPIHVRSSFSDARGTMITCNPEAAGVAVAAAALVRNEARVTVLGVPDHPGACFAIFSEVAAAHISVDMIVQNVGVDGSADIAFTVVRDDLKATLAAVEQTASELGARRVTHSDDVAKVSVVGIGMARQTGVAEKMFRALAAADVNIQMISTSEIKISVLVGRQAAAAALSTVHRAFALETEPPAARDNDLHATRRKPSDALAVVARLQKMEELTIDDISLDETQSRLTVGGVRNQPGVAAAIFEAVAAAGVFVDMIVQSFDGEETANISFTAPCAQYAKCVALVTTLAERMRCGPVSSSERVARLSIAGIGMRSHASVAIRTFECLAALGVNIDMINTSEVRLNVVVAGGDGRRALAALQTAFAENCR